MLDLKLFASEQYPLRCSGLTLLTRCPWRSVMLHLKLVEDTSGAAADTGSAVHKGISSWHTNGKEYSKALKSMTDNLSDYPLADLHDAELHFRPYTEDPRNQDADIIACETQITFQIKGVYFTGTFDQIRRESGRPLLWDVKTGADEGLVMVHEHSLQIAAYCIGATKLLSEPVYPGGIIRTRGYRKRGPVPVSPDGVFWSMPFSASDCETLLDGVIETVKRIRKGVITLGPGKHCTFCPALGMHECIPQLKRLKNGEV